MAITAPNHQHRVTDAACMCVAFSWRVEEARVQVASTVRLLPEVDLSHPLHSVCVQRQVWGGR
jgi:hypothetical protein